MRSCFQVVKKSMIPAEQFCLQAGEELIVMDCGAWQQDWKTRVQKEAVENDEKEGKNAERASVRTL